MIDTTKPLTEADPADLRAYLDALHSNRERYRLTQRIVEAGSCDLAISEATRALAIINRRATEVEARRTSAERTSAAMLRGLRNALLGWRNDVDEACLDWGHTVTDRIDAILKLAPSDEHWDRIVTIADEAFGLGPVEPINETLTRIERGIFAQHKRLSELQAQREADLRDAYLAGAEWESQRMPDDDEDAATSAAEYARSKAGG